MRRRHTIALDDFKGHTIRDLLAASHGDGSNKDLNHVIVIGSDGAVGTGYFEVKSKTAVETFYTLAAAVERYNDLP